MFSIPLLFYLQITEYIQEEFIKVFVSKYNHVACRFIDTFDYSRAPEVTIIVGKEGLGKTTLLNKLLDKYRNTDLPAVYVDAKKFSTKFSYAACNRGLDSFRKYFRSSKLFLLDNINCLKGKAKTIEELFYTIDTIVSQGGKTVLTYDGNDLFLDFFGKRLASRLKSGLVIHIQEPTVQELESFRQYYLKSKNATDIRLMQPESRIKNMRQAVDLFENNNLGRIPINEAVSLVLPFVCKHFNVEEKQVAGPGKTNNVVMARYSMFLLLHEKYSYSYKEISVYFNKDLSGLRKKSLIFKEEHWKLFESVCQKMYNQEQQKLS